MEKKADKLIYGGKIYTMEAEQPSVEAVALCGEVILYAGSLAEAEKLASPSAERIDLKGKCMYPGLIESHLHVPGNAYNDLYLFDMIKAGTVEEYLAIIAEHVKNNPERDAYFGRGFKLSLFPDQEKIRGPRKERLDEICKDKPIVVADSASHVRWLNSEAFRRYGIKEDTCVPGGVIEKDPDTGELWGTIKEEAKYLAPDPSFTDDEKKNAFFWLQNMLNGYGYTGMMALRTSPSGETLPMLEIMEALDQEGKLFLHACCAGEIKPAGDLEEQLEKMKAVRQRFRSKNLRFNTVKFFMDGTIDSATAYLKEPYEPAAGKGGEYYGEALWELKPLAHAFTRAMAEGFDIHVHAFGDAGVKLAVDAFESAQQKEGGEHRNTITHLQLVDEEEKVRMAKLGIIACINPYWYYKDPEMYDSAELPFLGEARAQKTKPVASLLKNGVRLTAAADHPITADPNPMHAIQAAATRNFYTSEEIAKYGMESIDDEKGLLNAQERIPVEEILKAYTINGAYALRMEDEIGSIRAGKYADFMITDRDLYKTNLMDLHKVCVHETFFRGKTVYKR